MVNRNREWHMKHTAKFLIFNYSYLCMLVGQGKHAVQALMGVVSSK